MFGLSKLWGYLAVVVGAAAAIGIFGAKKKAEGKSQERAKQTENIHEKVEKAEKVRRDVRADPGKRDRVSKFDRPK